MLSGSFHPPTIVFPLSLLAITTIAASIVSPSVVKYFGSDPKVTSEVVYCCVAMMAVMVLLYGIRLCGGKSSDLLIRCFHAKYIAPAVLWGGALAASAFGIELLVEYPMSVFAPQLAVGLYKLSSTTIATVLLPSMMQTTSALMVYVVAIPILEELVFRAYVLNRLAQRYGEARGLLLSSLVFGILHWPHVLSEWYAGMIFGMIFIRYRSLLACILAHASANALMTIGLSLTTFPFHKDIHHLKDFGNWKIEAFSLGCAVILTTCAIARLWPSVKGASVK